MYQKCVQSKAKENNQYLSFIGKFSKFTGNELQNKEGIYNITNGTREFKMYQKSVQMRLKKITSISNCLFYENFLNSLKMVLQKTD